MPPRVWVCAVGLLLSMGCSTGPAGHSPARSSAPAAASPLPGAPVSAATDTPAAGPGGAPEPAPSLAPGPVLAAPDTASPAARVACAVSSGGSGASEVAAIRMAAYPGFDRLVFEFTRSVPEFRIEPQDSTAFVADPSGKALMLRGVLGVRARFGATTALPRFPGGYDARPALANLREVRELGDFERVNTWGVGLASGGCFATTVLSGPPRLVLDFPS